MTKAVNLDALRSAEVATEPWRWAHYQGAFHEPEALAQVYPTSAMVLQPLSGYAPDATGDPATLDSKRSLIDLGAQEPSGAGDLDERWLQVAADLLSLEYRAALSDVVGFDLTGLRMRAVFHMFNETYSCRPHLDDERERVVHLLYLDGPSSANSGGRFQVLTSSDPQDLVAEIPPLPNQSIIQVRTEKSWHAVTPPAQGSKLPRKMLHVTWESEP